MSDDLHSQSQFENGFWVGDWFVDPMVNRVYHEDEGEEVQLEPKVMDVLLCLAERPEQTVTKEQFRERVWTDTVVTDDVLARCISQLRKTLGDDSQDPTYIETIRKTGYRLIAPVRVQESTSPGDATESASAAPAEPTDDGPSSRNDTEQALGGFQFFTAGDRAPWAAVTERIPQRKWLLVAGLLLGLGLLLTIISWLEVGGASSSVAPPPATPLTSSPGEKFDPAVSASGRQVAFAWRNVDSLYQNIYIMQQGAGRPLQLSVDSTVDWSPTWSPDERYVAYVREVRGEHQIYVVPSIGGRGRPVAHLSDRHIRDIVWSPDTSRNKLVMAAQRRPHQAYALTAVDPETDSTEALTTPPLWSTGDSSPVFSPDGSQIAFVRGTVEGIEDIFVMPADGGEVSQVTADSTAIYGLTWGQDGDRLMYSARRGGIAGLWEVSADGGSPELIRSANQGTVFSQPTLSSTTLAYTQESTELDVRKLSRSNRRAPFETESLFSSTQKDTHPSISPDGQQVAFVTERSGTPEVWLAKPDGSGLTKVTALGGPQIHSIAWSPDGTQLCFVAQNKGRTDLFTVPTSGGQATRLTQTEAHALVPRWSRDGRWIYYTSNQTGQWEVWRRSVASSTNGPEQVTVGGAVAAQESSTASTLYFVRPDTTGIWAMPLDTTHLPLRTSPRRRVLTADSVSASSNGASVLDTTKTDTTTATTSASAERVVSQFDPQERHNWWVKDGGIYFLRHRGFDTMVLTFYNFRTQDTVPLYAFANFRRGQHVAAGPNGNWFTYTHVTHRVSDLMLVEDFYKE